MAQSLRNSHPSEFSSINEEEDVICELYYMMNIDNKLSSSEKEELINKTKKIHEDYNLSGILLFDNNRLIHFLEGDSKSIQKLYSNKTVIDSGDYVLIKKGYRKNRRFNEWTAVFVQDKNNYPFKFIFDFDYSKTKLNAVNLYTLETYIHLIHHYSTNLHKSVGN